MYNPSKAATCGISPTEPHGARCHPPHLSIDLKTPGWGTHKIIAGSRVGLP
jgi:hypothetical protein